MSLYILRETWTEKYDCPDNGETDICETYIDIKISENPEALLEMAHNLNRGHVGHWTEKRSKELREIHPDYDMHRDSRFDVMDVSDLVI